MIMRSSTKLALAAVAALGLGAVAVPVVAHQMRHDGMAGHGMGMMDGSHQGMMGGHMGMMMGGAHGYAMTTFDTDNDGTLSAEEITAGIQSELTTYDADGDGSLSLDEFAAMHAAHTRLMTVRAFQMHDVDGDAQVTEAEMAAMADMMQRQMAGPQDGMPGMGQGKMGSN
jgi:hypothetical protein